MQRENKIYFIEKSPLYKLQSKHKLYTLLGITSNVIKDLRNDAFYKVFEITRKGKKPRTVQEPVGIRRIVHSRIFLLLKRIQTPDYLFSGKKSISYLDNSRYHQANNYFVTIDIEKYYPNCRYEYVFRFFFYQMKMSQDVAHLISRLVCYKEQIPTGSPLSQLIAYWAYSRTFDYINQLAVSKDLTFSLFVDDMVFSSQTPISKKFHLSINYNLKRVMLKLNKEKVKYRAKTHYKVVTGGAISPNGTLGVPNKLRLKIINTLQLHSTQKQIESQDIKSMLGMIRAGQLIEANFFNETYIKYLQLEAKLKNMKN